MLHLGPQQPLPQQGYGTGVPGQHGGPQGPQVPAGPHVPQEVQGLQFLVLV